MASSSNTSLLDRRPVDSGEPGEPGERRRAPIEPTAASDRTTPGRLIGIDIARAFALMGMVTQHVQLTGGDGGQSTGWVAWVFEQSAGRASVLFFVLSGLSLAIVAKRGSASAAPGALWRRGFLLLTGGLLLTITIWPASILQHYGVAFLVAPWLLRLGRRGLTAATAVGLIGGPVLLLFAANWTNEVNGLWDGSSGNWLVTSVWDVMVSGIYPMVLWIGFFTLGMLLGQVDLANTATRLRLLVAALLIALTAGIAAGALVDRFGEPSFDDGFGSEQPLNDDFLNGDSLNDDSLWKEKPDGTFEFLGDESKLKDSGFDSKFDSEFEAELPEVPADWRALYDVAGHSGRMGWTIQTGALAVAAMAIALLLPAALHRPLAPLAWMGSMSLTAYVMHILLVTDGFQNHVEPADWSIATKEFALLGLIGVMIAGCAVFRRILGNGPLERLLKHFTVGRRADRSISG